MSYDPASPDDRGQATGQKGPGGLDVSGFFAALFDVGFHRFATPSVVKTLYVLGMVLTGILYLYVVATAFAVGVGSGLLFLVVGALFALFSLALLRITLEFCSAVVRMSEDIHHRR